MRVGYFQADSLQTDQLSSMRLVVEGVNFVKQLEHPLALEAGKTGEQVVECGFDGVDKVKITSISLKADQLVIDYRVSLTDENATYMATLLKLSVDGQNITPIGTTVLPSDNQKEIATQAIYLANGIDPQRIHFDLAYNKIVNKIDGKWSVPLTLDAEKTKHASFTVKLNVEEIQAAYQIHKLEELVVTPTQIRINAKSLGFDNNWSQLTTYSNIQLKVGDILLNGGMFAENSGISFHFDAPFGKDWASQSMTLVMSDATSEVKSSKAAQFKLNNPNSGKQKVDFPVGGYPVEYTYYKQGQDLILESRSTDPAFGGMVQSVLDGKIYSDTRINNSPSRNANWQTEIFHGVPEGDITVSPWLYTTVDHAKRSEIKLK